MPLGVSERAKRLWRAVLDDYDPGPAELEVLRAALEALDRADAAAAIVKREGITVDDRYGTPKAHPAVDVELRARGLFARLCAQLGLRLADEEDEPPTTRRARQAANTRWAKERGRRRA